MPIPPIGKVTTGVATSLKLSAKDAGRLAKSTVDKATQEAANKSVTPGMIKYKTKGEGVFNCFTASGKKIRFAGHCFFLEKDNPNFDEIAKALDYFVSKKRITREEG